jgi:hypothetical protein
MNKATEEHISKLEVAMDKFHRNGHLSQEDREVLILAALNHGTRLQRGESHICEFDDNFTCTVCGELL